MCTSIWLENSAYAIEARCTGFSFDISQNFHFGYIGRHNTTDPVGMPETIELEKLVSWENQYGFFGRSLFDTAKIMDGINTHGLSVSVLYHADAMIPVEPNQPNRPVISVYDVPSYLLGMFDNVAQVAEALKNVCIIDSAVHVGHRYYINQMPIQILIRDEQGDSLLIQMSQKDGVCLYYSAGSIITDASFDQLTDINVPRDSQLSLMEQLYAPDTIPGGYGPVQRFQRASALQKILPSPKTRNEALFNANYLINTCLLPPLLPGVTPWCVLKDLNKKRLYFKYHGAVAVQGNYLPVDIMHGYTCITLSEIDWLSSESLSMTNTKSRIKVTPKEKVKKIQTLREFLN